MVSLSNHMQRIQFETSDGVVCVGNYFEATEAIKAVLLLHMMPATRASFLPFQEMLLRQNFTSLAIDLRGHGESVQSKDGPLDYRKFQDSDHQKSRLDVDAALAFLESKGFVKENISVVGASIGANLALDVLAREKSLKKAILLSPGLDYRGVLTESAARSLDISQKILIVAAEGDSYSAQSSKALSQILGEKSELILYPDEKHGTNMFISHSELFQAILNFLMPL